MIGLVDVGDAAEGYEFVYLGEAPECRGCTFRRPCHHNFEGGRKYVIREVKDIKHPCRLFGEVVVCDVDEVGVEAAINPSIAFDGSILTFEPKPCKNPFCQNFKICSPEGLKKGDRCLITEVGVKLECPLGGQIQAVKMKRA